LGERRRIEDEADFVASRGASHRLCAVTRLELEREELIRFVAAPDGSIVPDLGQELPGRGVWVKADKAIVAQAVAGHTFSKSLKRQVKADPGLAELVESLIVRRMSQALSLANKAGLLTTGFAQVEALIEGGTVSVLLHGSDAADGGREKLDRKFIAISRAKGRNAPIITSLSTSQLSLAMGRSNVVHAALIKGGATQRFIGEAERLERYRSGICASRGSLGPTNSEV
jgi:hypothetical protein